MARDIEPVSPERLPPAIRSSGQESGAHPLRWHRRLGTMKL